MIKKGMKILLGCALLGGVGFVFLSELPKPLPIPFIQAIRQQPDYQPPGEGVTFYPTDGPHGVGVIQTLATGPDKTVFVGTYGEGLFRSRDGGKTWTSTNLGLTDKFILNISTLPHGLLFAGTIRAGLFKSHDEGDHWVSVNRGLENTEVQSIASLPNGALVAGTGQGAFISKNKGEEWVPFNEGLGGVLVRSIVVDRRGTLYAGTQGKGIFKRSPTDSGWVQQIRGFLYEEVEERVVRTLLVGPRDTLYAGTLGAGLFRSRDAGKKWQRINSGLKNISIRALTMDEQGGLYVGTGEGIFYSQDHGDHWLPWGEGIDPLQIHSLAMGEAGTLYAGTGTGLFLKEKGESWQSLHAGLLVSPIQALDDAESGVVVGTAGKGIFIHKENQWIANNIGLVSLSIRAMASGPTYLYAVTDGGLSRRQVVRNRWEPLNAPASELTDIAVNLTEEVILATGVGLFQSTDHGKSWARVEPLGTAPVTAIATRGEWMLITTGKTLWIRSNTTDWKKVQQEEMIRHLAWGKAVFYAASDQALFQGTPAGALKKIEGPLPSGISILSLAVAPGGIDTLFLGTDRGLFFREDGGEGWRPAHLYQGERFEKRVTRLLPMGEETLWAGTETEGVFLGVRRIPKSGLMTRWLSSYKGNG